MKLPIILLLTLLPWIGFCCDIAQAEKVAFSVNLRSWGNTFQGFGVGFVYYESLVTGAKSRRP